MRVQEYRRSTLSGASFATRARNSSSALFIATSKDIQSGFTICINDQFSQEGWIVFSYRGRRVQRIPPASDACWNTNHRSVGHGICSTKRNSPQTSIRKLPIGTFAVAVRNASQMNERGSPGCNWSTSISGILIDAFTSTFCSTANASRLG